MRCVFPCFLTMVTQACVEYEMVDSQRGAYRAKLAIMISYPTTVSRTIVLILKKIAPKYRKVN